MSDDISNISSKLKLFDLFIALALKVILTCWKGNSKICTLTWWNLICNEHRLSTVSTITLSLKIKTDLLWLPFTSYLSSHPSLH